MNKFYLIFIFFLFSITSCVTSSRKISKSEVGQHEKIAERARIQAKYYFFEATREKQVGNYKQAAALYNKSLGFDPRNDAAYYELAKLYEVVGNHSAAITNAKKAIEHDKENLWYLALLADLHYNHQKFDKAVEVYREIATQHPDVITFQFDLASTLVLAGNYKEAIVLYDEIEKKLGLSEEVVLQKQNLYLRTNQQQKAIQEIQKLIDSDPSNAVYYGYLAELYVEIEETEKALETFHKILELDSTFGKVHLFLADYYQRLGEQEKAFNEMLRAFKSIHVDIDTKVQVLLNYYAAPESNETARKESYQLAEALVATHFNDAKSFAIHGDFLYRDNRLEEARSQYRKALEIDPSKHIIWNQVLIINSQLSDFKAMQSESEKAMDLFPTLPAFYLYNGIAKIQNKDYEGAIKKLKTGKELVVDNALILSQFYANLGDAHHELGNHEKSDHNYDLSLALDEENVFVLNNYSYYLSLRNDRLEKAEQMSKKANELQPNQPSFLDTYGWILFQMGKYKEAKVWLQKALDAGGKDNGVILEHFGDVAFKLGNVDEAVMFWKKALVAGNGSAALEQKIKDKKLDE